MTDEKREEIVERLSFYYKKERECRERGAIVAADSWAGGALGFGYGVITALEILEKMDAAEATRTFASIERDARERARADAL